MPRNTENKPMEESPLMHKPPLHSTISPEKMDQSRFTEMRDLEEEKSNPLRIIVYAIIVIVVGVGLAFLVRTLILNNQQSQESPEQENENTPEETSAYLIALTPKNDASATNLAANEDYVDSPVVTLGDATLDMTSVVLQGIRYDRYTTFARTTFDFDGNGTSLPKTTINYDVSENQLRLTFQDLTEIDEELLEEKMINDIVESISYDEDTEEFVITFSEESKYRVVQSGSDLVIDVKTLEELEKPETETPSAGEEEPATPPATPPAASGEKPNAPHYENEFSTETQYISSSISTNTLGFNNFWIWDEGSFFEFSIGQTDAVGTQYIPNATAYLEEEDNKTYLMLEVENLSNAPFSQTKTRTLQQLIDTSGASINPDTVNFVRIELVSFAGGKATYKIELKDEAEFKLISQKTYDNTTQILSLQIRD